MIKHTFLLTVLSLWLSQAAFAQVDDIKELAQDYTSNIDGDFFTNELWMFDLFIDFFWIGIDYHMWQLDNSSEIPKIISVDVLPQAGIGKNGLVLLSPRIRGNFGLFTSDFRYNVLANDGLFPTLDWQIVALNMVNTKYLTLRVGTGIMHEQSNNNTFTEHTLGLDVHVPESPFLVNWEGRLAKNYFESTTPRLETNMHLAYKTMSFDHADIYVLGGFTWQKYYSEINIWAIQTGLKVTIQ